MWRRAGAARHAARTSAAPPGARPRAASHGAAVPHRMQPGLLQPRRPRRLTALLGATQRSVAAHDARRGAGAAWGRGSGSSSPGGCRGLTSGRGRQRRRWGARSTTVCCAVCWRTKSTAVCWRVSWCFSRFSALATSTLGDLHRGDLEPSGRGQT